MGTVYVASDPELDRKVALKVLHVGNEGAQERLQREARAMARLSHPNVVPVYEISAFDGGRFFTMELLEGGTLGHWALGRTWREVLRACIEAGRGLECAHEAGLIHRDFKPANVLCDVNGRARVTDFGLVAAVAHQDTSIGDTAEGPGEDRLTQTGWAVGTPAYMAPEQAEIGANERSDQFAFCLTTWEVLSGAHPWGGGHERTPPPRWPVNAPKVPGRVVDALLRGLSLDPKERWPSMGALLEELSAAIAPRRAGLGTLVSLLAVGTVAGISTFALTRSPSTPPCSDGDDNLVGVWDGERRVQLREALLATNVAHAEDTAAQVETLLDAYGEGWVQSHQAACLATVRGEQSSDLLDLKMSCLRDRLGELGALVEVLSSADSSIASRAVAATRGLSRLQGCEDGAALSNTRWEPEPDQLAALERSQDHVNRALVLRNAGQHAEGLAEARSAVREADSLQGSPVHRQARYMEGLLLEADGEPEAALEILQAVALDAGRVGDDETAAKASTALVSVLGGRLARTEEAVTWALHADVAIDRARLGPRWKMRLQTVLGVGYNVARKFEKASEAFEQALSFASDGDTDDKLDHAQALAELANLQQSRANYEEALVLHRQALELTREANGPDHPRVGALFDNIGNALSALGRLEEAESFHKRALEVLIAQGSDHPSYKAALANLGSTLFSAGKLEEAIVVLEQAVDGADESVNTGMVYVNLAAGLASLKRYEEASRYGEQGQRILEAKLGETHAFVASALINLGITHRHAGKLEAAETALRRAVAIAQSQEFPPADLARARFALAQVVGRTKEGRLLARQAVAGFVAVGLGEEAVRVEAFLDGRVSPQP